jgi:hypothetical protein
MTIAKKKLARWTTLLALAAGAANVGAQTLAADAPVWIDNDSFGFEACAATTRQMGAADIDAVLASARALAAGEITQALRTSGITLGGERFMTMTPIAGSMACGTTDTQVSFRVAAVDRATGKFWTTELAVRGTVSTANNARLSDLLAGHFGGVVVANASPR